MCVYVRVYTYTVWKVRFNISLTLTLLANRIRPVWHCLKALKEKVKISYPIFRYSERKPDSDNAISLVWAYCAPVANISEFVGLQEA